MTTHTLREAAELAQARLCERTCDRNNTSTWHSQECNDLVAALDAPSPTWEEVARRIEERAGKCAASAARCGDDGSDDGWMDARIYGAKSSAHRDDASLVRSAGLGEPRGGEALARALEERAEERHAEAQRFRDGGDFGNAALSERAGFAFADAARMARKAGATL